MEIPPRMMGEHINMRRKQENDKLFFGGCDGNMWNLMRKERSLGNIYKSRENNQSRRIGPVVMEADSIVDDVPEIF